MTEADVEDIVHSRGHAAIEFIERIYEMLTHKQLPPLSGPAAQARIASSAPAYARDTASRAIHQASREPRIAMVSDAEARHAIMEEALKAHQTQLQRDRAEDPSRYVPLTVRAREAHRVMRGAAPRAMSREQGPGMRRVQVKRVQVEGMEGAGEGEVARLRAQREAQAAAGGAAPAGAAAASGGQAGGALAAMQATGG